MFILEFPYNNFDICIKFVLLILKIRRLHFGNLHSFYHCRLCSIRSSAIKLNLHSLQYSTDLLFFFFSFPSFAFKSWHSSPGFKDIKKHHQSEQKKKTSKIHPQTSQKKKAPVLFALVAIYALYIFPVFFPHQSYHSAPLQISLRPYHTTPRHIKPLSSLPFCLVNQPTTQNQESKRTNFLPSFLPSIQFLFLFPFSFFLSPFFTDVMSPQKKNVQDERYICDPNQTHRRTEPK